MNIVALFILVLTYVVIETIYVWCKENLTHKISFKTNHSKENEAMFVIVSGLILPAPSVRNHFVLRNNVKAFKDVSRMHMENWPSLGEIANSMYDARNIPVSISMDEQKKLSI